MKSRHIQRIICPCPKFFLKSPQNNKRKQVQTFFKGQRINTTHMTLFIVVFTMSTRIDLYKKVKNYKGLNVLPSQTQLALGVLVVEVVVVGRHSVSSPTTSSSSGGRRHGYVRQQLLRPSS